MRGGRYGSRDYEKKIYICEIEWSVASVRQSHSGVGD